MIKWKDWLKIFLIFIIPIFLDQILKLLTQGLRVEAVVIGWIGFFSNFSNSESYTSSLYAPLQEIKSLFFLIFCLCFVQTNILLNTLFALSRFVRTTISFILGGFLSVFLDQFVYGQMINNLGLTFNSQQFFGFNLAILFVCVGFILLSIVLIFKPQEILNPESIRQTLLTGDSGQKKLIISLLTFFTIIYYIVCALVGVFVYVAALSLSSSKIIRWDMVQYFCLVAVTLYFCLIPLIYTLAVRISNRIYGPFYGFQNYMKTVFEKPSDPHPPFKIRKKDYFKELESFAEYIRTRILRKL